MRHRLLPILFLAVPFGDVAARAQGMEEIQACVRANVPKGSVVEVVELRSRGRTGQERSVVARHWWKQRTADRSKHLIRAEFPPDVHGSTFLIIEDDEKQEVFSYLPELRKVRRLQARSVSGSLLGTDFSYEDFRQLQDAMRDPRGERLPDAFVGDRPAFVMQLAPAVGSPYERILAFIDQETCVPLELRFHRKGGKLWKRLLARTGSIRQTGTSWVVHSLVIRDLADETETELEIREIDLEAELSDRLFSASRLERLR